eukprot:5275710-Amphidinium_carterae.1
MCSHGRQRSTRSLPAWMQAKSGSRRRVAPNRVAEATRRATEGRKTGGYDPGNSREIPQASRLQLAQALTVKLSPASAGSPPMSSGASPYPLPPEG